MDRGGESGDDFDAYLFDFVAGGRFKFVVDSICKGEGHF